MKLAEGAPSHHTPRLRSLPRPFRPAGAVATGSRAPGRPIAIGAPHPIRLSRVPPEVARLLQEPCSRSAKSISPTMKLAAGAPSRHTCASCHSGRPVRSLQEHCTSALPPARALMASAPGAAAACAQHFLSPAVDGSVLKSCFVDDSASVFAACCFAGNLPAASPPRAVLYAASMFAVPHVTLQAALYTI